MPEIQRLDGRSVGLVPTVNRHLAGRGGQPGGKHDVFLVAGYQGTQGIGRQLGTALLAHDRVVPAEHVDCDHRRARRNGGGRQFDGCGSVDGVHHPARRQRAIQEIGNPLPGVR